MLGEALALTSALVWACSVILFKRSEAISPLGMNLFKNTVALALTGLTLLALGLGPDPDRSLAYWLRLIGSGILGLAVGDALFFTSLRKLGAGLAAVVACCYAPLITLLSVIFLGERPGWAFLLGAPLVVGGVYLATGEKVAGAPARLSGVLYGIAAELVMAVGVILAKPPLEDSHLVEATFVRLAAGVSAQAAFLLAFPAYRGALSVFRPSPAWRTLVPGAVLGAYIVMLLWLGGFKYADASVASVLNQTSTVWTILLGALVLKEKLTGRRLLGAGLALAGVLAILAG